MALKFSYMITGVPSIVLIFSRSREAVASLAQVAKSTSLHYMIGQHRKYASQWEIIFCTSPVLVKQKYGSKKTINDD